MQDGWQVFVPVLDHGHHTDILISDGPCYHRLQVKSLRSTGKGQQIQNLWQGNPIDWVILFIRNGDWGVIAPAFAERQRPLQHPDHRRFTRRRRDFLKQFHQI